MSFQEFYQEHKFLTVLLMLIGGCCAWCCLAHCIFMRICTCLKRKHKLNEELFYKGDNQPCAILSAHRGGSAERAENTLGAFAHAAEKGINLMELDVHLSQDGEVVINHDVELGRICGPEYQG